MLRCLIHVAKAPETVTPSQRSVVVKHKTALSAFSVLKLPRAHWTPINTVFLVSYWAKGAASSRLETAFKQAACPRICIVLVLLYNIRLFLLPFCVLFYCLAGRKQFGSVYENQCHFSDLSSPSSQHKFIRQKTVHTTYAGAGA
jgi:hypothetical protein